MTYAELFNMAITAMFGGVMYVLFPFYTIIGVIGWIIAAIHMLEK